MMSREGRHPIVHALVAVALLIAAAPCALQADLITLEDSNSVVRIDTQSASQTGVYDWTVDGVDQLKKQWVWFRIGSTGPELAADDPSMAVLAGQLKVLDTDSDGKNDRLIVRYTGNGCTITLSYTLRGGAAGSGWSDMAENISVTNTTNKSMSFHLFLYTDFDLLGTAANDTLGIVGGNTALQADMAHLSDISSTVASPAPSRVEASTGTGLLGRLTDSDADNLTGATGTVYGDCVWAYQWDFTLGAGKGYSVAIDKLVAVPEPATVLLLLAGGLTMTGAAVRRRMRAA